MKVIDLLNKIVNGELENGTKFRDKYTQKEYIFKPNSYAGIYPPDTSKSDEDWLLTLHSGCFRLDQEVEIIEEDKKIEKLELEPLKTDEDLSMQIELVHYENLIIANKINEIIDHINKEDKNENND